MHVRALLCSLALATAACRHSGDRPVAPAAIEVRVVGAGASIVLVAGLGCDDDVWRGAIDRWAGRFQLHLVTVAGFAGRAPGPPPVLGRARAALTAYVRQLDRPILVGHSLGAVIGYGVAADLGPAVRAFVALDGVPYGAALAEPAVTPASVTARARARRAAIGGLAPSQAAASARMFFGSMVTAPTDLERLVERGARSHLPTLAQAMYELSTTDLRADAATIAAPTLLLVAGADVTDEDLPAYAGQLAAIPRHEIARVDGARHFVMLDAPDATYDAIERFVATAR